MGWNSYFLSQGIPRGPSTSMGLSFLLIQYVHVQQRKETSATGRAFLTGCRCARRLAPCDAISEVAHTVGNRAMIVVRLATGHCTGWIHQLRAVDPSSAGEQRARGVFCQLPSHRSRRSEETQRPTSLEPTTRRRLLPVLRPPTGSVAQRRRKPCPSSCTSPHRYSSTNFSPWRTPRSQRYVRYLCPQVSEDTATGTRVFWLVWWCVGVLVCWCVGVLVGWWVGVLVCGCVGLLVCWFVGVLACWIVGVDGWLLLVVVGG